MQFGWGKSAGAPLLRCFNTEATEHSDF